MFCKNCGDKLGPDDRFCGSCGTPKVDLCPTCGQVWEKDKAEQVISPESTPAPRGITSSEKVAKSMPATAVIPQSQSPTEKIEITTVQTNRISSARVQPVYGKLYELGKDCPNCGEKGQKGKKCSTCKGTF